MSSGILNRRESHVRDGLGQILLAVGLIALGSLGLIAGDFALQWQPVPSWVPWRLGLANLAAMLDLICGVGLLFRPAMRASARVLLFYFLAWFLLLKTWQVFAAPFVEANWNGLGEIAVLVSAGMVLDSPMGRTRVQTGGDARHLTRLKLARVVFGVALIPIGLSHFFYGAFVAGMVPSWLPLKLAWAYLCGVGHLAAGVGVLLGVFPRLAATLEAVMIMVFTLLVWVPGLAKAPTAQLPWTEVIISWILGAAAWVVADSYAGERWLPGKWGVDHLRPGSSWPREESR